MWECIANGGSSLTKVAEPIMDTLASLGTWNDPIYMWLSRRVRNWKCIRKQTNWIPLTTQISKRVHNRCGYLKALLNCNQLTELSLSLSLPASESPPHGIKPHCFGPTPWKEGGRVSHLLPTCWLQSRPTSRLEQLRQIISTCTDIVRAIILNWGVEEDSAYPSAKPSCRSAQRCGRA